jgi:hypothetical protein
MVYNIGWGGDHELSIYHEQKKEMRVCFLGIPTASFNTNIIYKPGRYTILVDRHYRKMSRKTEGNYRLSYCRTNINPKRWNKYKSWRMKLKHPYYFLKRFMRKWIFHR